MTLKVQLGFVTMNSLVNSKINTSLKKISEKIVDIHLDRLQFVFLCNKSRTSGDLDETLQIAHKTVILFLFRY